MPNFPANALDSAPAKHLAVVVTFSWGDPAHTRAYARWDSDVEGKAFAAPELSVETDKQHGGTADVPYRVTLDRVRQPLDKLLRPYAHAPVTVAVGEVDPWDWDATYREVFFGTVVQSARNVAGSRRLCRLEVAGLKARMAGSVGVPATGSCDHAFGDEGCGYPITSVTEAVTVEAVTGREVEVSGAAGTGDYYSLGEIRVDGLSLLVAEASGSVLKLSKPPPPEWEGQAARLIPGCDKKVTGGCTFWNNVGRFRGLGVRMPVYHPNYEQAP